MGTPKDLAPYTLRWVADQADQSIRQWDCSNLRVIEGEGGTGKGAQSGGDD